MAFTLLTPWLLAGVALIAAPIVLHLLMRKQPKSFDFPALRFLRQRQETNRRTLRLRHLLLLAARCGAIFLLALALARPSFSGGGVFGDEAAPVAAAFVFDTSPRMNYRQDNQTRLEVAREIGVWMLTQLPAESEAAILDTSTAGGDFAPDLIVAKQRIESLKPTTGGRPFAESLDTALRLCKANDRKERGEVYLFTDLARAAWPERDAERLQALRAEFPQIALYIVDVGALDPRNTSLGDLRLNAQTLPPQGTLLIETQATRVGPADDAEIALYLLDDQGRPQKKGQVLRDLQADQSDAVQFRLPQLAPGTHQGFVKILGEDALPDDDTRYFTVESRDARQILIAAPPPTDRYAFFLKQALDPEPLRRAGMSRFDCKTIALDQLSRTELGQYAAICLLDPRPLDAPAAEKLRDYVKAGGGLAIWLGHNAEITTFNAPPLSELMPGKLVIKALAGEKSFFLAPQDLQHPVMAAFRGTETSNPWIDFPVFQYWSLELNRGVDTVLTYNNRAPALLEMPLGRGKILTMTTPVSESGNDPNAWNMLATGFEPWPFVMLSNEMLLYLAGNAEERFNYLTGEEVVFRIPEAEREANYTLTTPTGDVSAPTLDRANGILRTAATEFPGRYELKSGGTENGVRRGFSVNLPATETQLTRIVRDDLETMLGKGTFRLARTREEIDRTVTTGRNGTELFPLLILLTAFVLGAEHVLAGKFYRRDKIAAETQIASLAGFSGRDDTPAPNAASQSPDHVAADAWPTRKQAPPPEYRPAPPPVREPPRVVPPPR